jgi:hypothetical protein
MPDPALQVEGNDARPAVGELRPSALSMLQIIPPGHVLRPAWQRALSGSLFIVSGVVVAASILAARSRVVRCISYVRASKETPGVPPSIYIQTAGHSRKLGNAYPIKDCRLAPSNEDRLMLEIRDHGKWVLDLRGAKIANRVAPEDRTLARSTMLKTWKSVNGST